MCNVIKKINWVHFAVNTLAKSITIHVEDPFIDFFYFFYYFFFLGGGVERPCWKPS